MEGLDHAVGGSVGEGEDIDAALARRLDAILDAGSDAEPQAARSGVEASHTSATEWPAFSSFAAPPSDPAAASFSFSDLGAKGAHAAPGHGTSLGGVAQPWFTAVDGAAPGLAGEAGHSSVRWRGIAPLSEQDPFSAWGAKGSALPASSVPASGAGAGRPPTGAGGGVAGGVAAEALAAWHSAPVAVTTAAFSGLDHAPAPTHAPVAPTHQPAGTTLSASANSFVRGQAPHAAGQSQGRGAGHALGATAMKPQPQPRLLPQQHLAMSQQRAYLGPEHVAAQPVTDAGALPRQQQQQHPQYPQQYPLQPLQRPPPQPQAATYLPAASPYGMTPLSGPAGASFQMHRTTSAPVPGYAAMYPGMMVPPAPGTYAAMPPAAVYGPAFAGHVRPPAHALMAYGQHGVPMAGMMAHPTAPLHHPYRQYAAPRAQAIGPTASTAAGPTAVASTAGPPGTSAAATTATVTTRGGTRAHAPVQPSAAPAGPRADAAVPAGPLQPNVREGGQEKPLHGPVAGPSTGAPAALGQTSTASGRGAAAAAAPSADVKAAKTGAAAASNGEASKGSRSRNPSVQSAAAAPAPVCPPRAGARGSSGASSGGGGVVAAPSDEYPWVPHVVDPPSPRPVGSAGEREARDGAAGGERVYCEVQFKGSRRAMFVHEARTVDSSPLALAAEHLVKVDADRGVDLGRVVRVLGEKEFAAEAASAGGEEAKPRCKRLLRRATLEETRQLVRKAEMEEEALEFCRKKVAERELPMHVIDAEYQFDHRKLTFFFDAEKRIDFRELVRDLFAMYRTRIWLQQLSHGGRR